MILAIALLMALTAQATIVPEAPECGAFFGVVLQYGEASNCTVARMLAGNAYVESQSPVEMCKDVRKEPAGAVPRTAVDKGIHTGNESYLLYTSGSGRFIHQVFMDKTDAPLNVSVRCELPPHYSFVLGFRVALNRTKVFVVTLDELITCGEEGSTVVAHLHSLSLSRDTFVAASNDHVYLLDGSTMHVIDLTSFATTSLVAEGVHSPVVALSYIEPYNNLVVVTAARSVLALTPETGACGRYNICTAGPHSGDWGVRALQHHPSWHHSPRGRVWQRPRGYIVPRG